MVNTDSLFDQLTCFDLTLRPSPSINQSKNICNKSIDVCFKSVGIYLLMSTYEKSHRINKDSPGCGETCARRNYPIEYKIGEILETNLFEIIRLQLQPF